MLKSSIINIESLFNSLKKLSFLSLNILGANFIELNYLTIVEYLYQTPLCYQLNHHQIQFLLDLY